MKNVLLTILGIISFHFSFAQWMSFNSSGINNPYYSCLTKRGNEIYVLTSYLGGGGTMLSRFNGNTWQYTSLPYDAQNSIDFDIDANGNIWFAVWAEPDIYEYDGSTWQSFPNVGENYFEFNDIMVDDSNHVWVLAEDFNDESKVLKYDGANWETYNVLNADGFGFFLNFRSHLVEAANGNILITDAEHGIYKFNGSVFDTVSFGNYFARGCGMDKADANGRIWFLAGEDFFHPYLASYDGNSFSVTNHLFPPDPDLTYSATSDNNGNLWFFATDSGRLVKFNGDTLTEFRYPLPDDEAWSDAMDIIADDEGQVWIGVYPDSLHNVLLFNEGGFSQISGKVFYDSNQNGIFDGSEEGIDNVILHETSLEHYCNSDSLGNYLFSFLDSTQQYNLKIQNLPYWNLTTPSLYQLIPQQQSTTGYDFGIYPSATVNDLQISVTSIPPRPYFNTSQWISIKNVGTTTLAGNVSYSLDPQYIFVSSTPAPDLITGNTLSFNFSDFPPFGMKTISLNLQLSNSISVGDSLFSVAAVYPIFNDENAADNSFSLNQEVASSFDPNEKIVEPIGDVPSGAELTYTIHFQNTGTAAASIVVIRDTLDSDLDPATLQIEGSSHPMKWTIKGPGNIEFRFDPINLPDSAINELASHGFVKYSIKTKPNLEKGTEIKNGASIYFDFNSAVRTNTTVNTIGFPIGIENIDSETSLKTFPNPATTLLSIKVQDEKIVSYSLYSIEGKLLLNKVGLNVDETTMNVRNLNAGLYLLQVTTSTSLYNQQIEVMR